MGPPGRWAGAGGVGVTAWVFALGLRDPGPLFALMVTKTIGFIGMSRIVLESALEPNWPFRSNSVT